MVKGFRTYAQDENFMKKHIVLYYELYQLRGDGESWPKVTRRKLQLIRAIWEKFD